MAGAVAAPERGLPGAAIDTLSALDALALGARNEGRRHHGRVVGGGAQLVVVVAQVVV